MTNTTISSTATAQVRAQQILIPIRNPFLFRIHSRRTASKLSVSSQKPEQEELKKTLPFPFALPKQKESSKKFIKLNTNVEQHCYENRIGEDEILLEDKEKCFTEPAFPTGEKWTCAQVKEFGHLLIGVGVGPCVNGEHTLMHKLQGGSADEDSKVWRQNLKN